MSLSTWPSDPAKAEVAISRNGFYMLNWSANGANFWAVSDLGEAELREFVLIYRWIRAALVS
jgi:anti-sigma factor RsiW